MTFEHLIYNFFLIFVLKILSTSFNVNSKKFIRLNLSKINSDKISFLFFNSYTSILRLFLLVYMSFFVVYAKPLEINTSTLVSCICNFLLLAGNLSIIEFSLLIYYFSYKNIIKIKSLII